MKSINTTFGSLPINQLGAVDVHEHIIIDSSENSLIPEYFHHTDVEKIADELSDWKTAGGGVIIDSSPIGAGRNIQLLEETSQKASLPVIACSGFHKLSYYSKEHWLFTESEVQIYKLLIDECQKGVLIDDLHPNTSNRSHIKAGMLKIGVDLDGISPIYSKILSATAKTMDETGINCMIHTEPGVPFTKVVQAIKRNHIKPNKVIFCHMGKSLDFELHQRLAREGFYLEFDEMVRSSPPFTQLALAILNLYKQGYGQSILFAGDLARRSYWTCYGGKPGLPYLLTRMHDDLKNLGFTQSMLEEIWVKNPQRFFS